MREATLEDKAGGDGATTMIGDYPTAVTTGIAIITKGEIITEGREPENGAPTIAVIITPAQETKEEETTITTEAAGTEIITTRGTGLITEITAGTATIGEIGREQKTPQPTTATATLTQRRKITPRTI